MKEPGAVEPPNYGGEPASEKERLPASQEAVPEPSKRPTVSDYDLLRRIGSGAYGEVWLARSVATGALRAAKIVWRNRFEDERPFRREFEGIQRFEQISREHPSQLALFHIGRNDPEGYFYYVMELADPLENSKPETPAVAEAIVPPELDQPSAFATRSSDFYSPHTLRAELENGRLPASRVLEIGLALAEALSHLHRNGLVHRDVKPSNVIFVKGRPKLADIGLVTDASDQCSIVGTEGYLPPEGPGTPQADIFALGKVLYEAVTGLDRRSFPKMPEDLREWPDKNQVFELNEIILQACAREPDRRYLTCQEMHQELALLEGGKSVRQAHQVQLRWRLARRFGVWVVAGAVALSLVVLAIRSRQATTASYVEKSSTNALANSYFELGKINLHMLTATNMQRANELFKQAIAADPNFGAAHGYLAATYFWSDDSWNPHWQFLPKAKVTAEKALKLDDTLAEPHLALGWYYGMGEWNWKVALKHEERAVELNPSSFCHLCYAELLRVVGRTNEALPQILQAKNLDPHSRIINVRLIHYFTNARQFDKALAQIDEAVAMQGEKEADAVWDRRDLFLALHRIDDALEAERAGRIAQGESKDSVDRDIADLKLLPPTKAEKVIWRRILDWNKQHGDLYEETCCHAQLNEPDQAFTCLMSLLQKHDTSLTFGIMTDWQLDPLRADPRFHDILRKMNLE